MNAARDHRDEHVGCRAVFPWMKQCSRWDKPELLRRAAAEVVGMKPGYGDWWLEHMRINADYNLHKNNRRDDLISNLEGYDRQELNILADVAEARGPRYGLSKIQIAHEAATHWNEKRQRLALGVLFAYGEIR